MSKARANKQPGIKKESGSVVKYSEGGAKGGFRPDPNTTVLGTMNGIMKEQYEGK
tara:strand:+ start:2671 stop:2835 length:165 start_codon:yes stop_codon:yes gene_type:complete